MNLRMFFPLSHLRTTHYALCTRSAFTLVEVLVVVGVTALLASIIVSYSSASRDHIALQVEGARFAQTIARAKSLTLATYASRGEDVPCGYGVDMDYDAHTYALFAYPSGECANIAGVDPGIIAENTVDRGSLPPNVRLLNPDEDSVQTILFIPPEPATLIWHVGDIATSTFGKIIMAPLSGAPQRRIEVGVGGQITF